MAILRLMRMKKTKPFRRQCGPSFCWLFGNKNEKDQELHTHETKKPNEDDVQPEGKFIPEEFKIINDELIHSQR